MPVPSQQADSSCLLRSLTHRAGWQRPSGDLHVPVMKWRAFQYLLDSRIKSFSIKADVMMVKVDFKLTDYNQICPLRSPRVTSTSGEGALSYCGPALWNKLSADLKTYYTHMQGHHFNAVMFRKCITVHCCSSSFQPLSETFGFSSCKTSPSW